MYFPAYDGLTSHRSLPLFDHSCGPVSTLRLILYRILSDGSAWPCTGSFVYCIGVTLSCESVFHLFLACYRPLRVPSIVPCPFGSTLEVCLFGGSNHLSFVVSYRGYDYCGVSPLVSRGLHSPAPWVAARTSDITMNTIKMITISFR